MQQVLGAPIRDGWDSAPTTVEEWQALRVSLDQAPRDPQPILDQFGITSEPIVVNGVPAHLLTPSVIPPENRDRLLMYLHGGCYVMGGGQQLGSRARSWRDTATSRSCPSTIVGPPEFRYPAALDDAVSAWKGALEMAAPNKMAIFGASAGGALTLSTVLRLKQEGLALPAAIAPGMPIADLTRTGDSFNTNRLVDNVLVGPEGRCQAMAALYADGHDLRDPMLSPVYGDMRGFPPAILTTGTRDLLLSDTVRVHRKLRQAGVDAELHVYEAQAHGHYIRDTPERKEAFEEIARFLGEHLEQ